MKIVKATRDYEEWLGKHIKLVPEDLRQKHINMTIDPFVFLRATFYRWAQRFSVVCPKLQALPMVLAVNDLHIENFGTWRDGEGRLVWGINDFDEAHPSSFAVDLTRLATSACLAIEIGRLGITHSEICESILEGYVEGLRTKGCPFVLQEAHLTLREMAINRLKEPAAYWAKLDSQKKTVDKISDSGMKALTRLFPSPGLHGQPFHRQAGQGALGRERYVATAQYLGGLIAREVKAFAPSACYFAAGKVGKKSYYERLVKQSVRCPDPFLRVTSDWIGRRLAPDCSRIELVSLPKNRDERSLLKAMGFETANIHLGSAAALDDVARSLRGLPHNWLKDAAEAMSADTIKDFHEWRKRWPSDENGGK